MGHLPHPTEDVEALSPCRSEVGDYYCKQYKLENRWNPKVIFLKRNGIRILITKAVKQS
jgi:hypothetical protein